MAVDMSFLIADQDHYEPWDTADPGPRYDAGPMPDGWTRQDSGAWTHWGPAGLLLPDQGWKIHVSSSLANAQSVLTVVATACAEAGVPFKHLAGREMFLHAHGKHANRVQSGKFCTLYPPTEQCARSLLTRLAGDLSGISGPFVLSDRRFGASECVSYRYGAFRGRLRVDADGNQVPTMAGPDGREIDDERRPAFHLPPGVADPFRTAAPEAATGPVTLHGYSFEAVIRHGNAGGAYRFRSPAGEQVFVKEARAHNGYTPDGADAKTRLNAEYLTLRAIHGRRPGLCPRPVELFHHWEHSYLVTEFTPGVPLYRWMVLNNPAVRIGPDAAAFAEYHRRCLALLDRLDAQLERLHELGYVFVDLSPTNVLVDDEDQVRLVDFEAVQRAGDVRRIMGTPGYLHPDPRSAVERDPRELDRFGLAALALLLLFPLHEVAERHPRALDHLYADLTELAPVPPRLWQWATHCHDRSEAPPPPAPGSVRQGPGLPTPRAVREDTVAALRRLADRTADALEAAAQPDHPVRVYPTNPMGHQTGTRAVAAGTAGVLYALHRAGRSCDPRVVRRLRDETMAAAETGAPGLLYGTAGIACVLAGLGESEAAGSLLATAAAHPLNDTVATLGAGAAGTALGLLVHHGRTGEQRWLDLAQRLLERVPDGDELTFRLSRTNRSGLVGGRTGVALALYALYRRTGDSRPFARGMRLLREELAYAEPIPVDGLGFRLSHDDRRVYPYLFGGSAGYAAVLSRYLACRPDAEFDVIGDGDLGAADALERCLRACTARFAVFPGLFPGLAGLAVTLADAGRRLGRPELMDAALTSARGLFRSAVPREDGVGWLGEPGQRLSADLWSGSAGILLALCRLTDPAPAPLDTLDGHSAGSRVAVVPASMERSGRRGRGPAFAE
ncbi:class III lanthionine synthetase LanKC [Actinoallomurus soli]|uniref:class III lanthionine synthetase LanKC n=1 Tax=Actinoallomurus soli TaxID=2952535 RepID=UPI00209234B9|nr:class III lanthionine synthetase LanKC [Actinoallomurus soli]MCO5973033.1 class III lanthionine synthetase LanKC [Actinoallomurus soli]